MTWYSRDARALRHEPGHAVLAFINGLSLKQVVARLEDAPPGCGGVTQTLQTPSFADLSSEEMARRSVQIFAAGRLAAEDEFDPLHGSHPDEQKALSTWEATGFPYRWLRDQVDETREILNRPDVSRALLSLSIGLVSAKGVLVGTRAERVIASALLLGSEPIEPKTQVEILRERLRG